jgi:hypothetical protein
MMAVPEKLYPGQIDSWEAIKNEMSSLSEAFFSGVESLP